VISSSFVMSHLLLCRPLARQEVCVVRPTALSRHTRARRFLLRRCRRYVRGPLRISRGFMLRASHLLRREEVTLARRRAGSGARDRRARNRARPSGARQRDDRLAPAGGFCMKPREIRSGHAHVPTTTRRRSDEREWPRKSSRRPNHANFLSSESACKGNRVSTSQGG